MSPAAPSPYRFWTRSASSIHHCKADIRGREQGREGQHRGVMFRDEHCAEGAVSAVFIQGEPSPPALRGMEASSNPIHTQWIIGSRAQKNCTKLVNREKKKNISHKEQSGARLKNDTFYCANCNVAWVVMTYAKHGTSLTAAGSHWTAYFCIVRSRNLGPKIVSCKLKRRAHIMRPNVRCFECHPVLCTASRRTLWSRHLHLLTLRN